MKIRNKLAILLLITSLLPLIGVMTMTFWYSSNHVKNAALNTASEYLSQSATMLSGYFSTRIAEISAYAQTPLLKSMDWSRIRPFLLTQQARHAGTYEKFILGMPDGHFRNTIVGNPHRDYFASFDDTDPDARLKSIARRPYWQALAGDNTRGAFVTHVSNPMISYTTGVRQVVVGASIVSDDKRLLGMLGGAVSWSEIEQLIGQIRVHVATNLGEDVRLSIIDSDGTYIYHWNPDKVVHLLLDDEGRPILNEIGEKTVILHSITDSPHAAVAAAGAAMMRGETGFTRFDSNDHRDSVIMLYAPVPAAQYAIAMQIPESEIMAPVEQLTNLLALFALVTAISLLILAWPLSHKVSRRILELSIAARKVGEGDLDAKTRPRGADELGGLMRAFNSMADALKLREQQLLNEYDLRHRAEQDALMDGLTGIPNRRSLNEVLEKEFRRAKRLEIPLAVIMIDIDHFKAYNDHAGHLAGDDALKTIANKLAERIQRSGDYIARFGGEEFCVVLPDTDAMGAEELAEQLRKGIEAMKLTRHNADEQPWFTISIGISSFVPDENSSVDDLIYRADQALYDAKNQGRNRSCVWQDNP